MHKGSCLCGSVQFEFDSEPVAYGVCNCKSCQKASGSAFGANIPVPIEDFRFRQGEATVKEYESSPGKRRCFCGNCGSPLFAKVGDPASTYRVRLGSLDTTFSLKPACHYFSGDRPDWHRDFDELKKFQGWPDRDFLELQGSKQR